MIKNLLDQSAIIPILIPTVLGALLGALLASYLPVTILKPVLLGSMLVIALITLVKPSVIAPPAGTLPYHLRERPGAAAGLFLAGLYGGFVQAGVGFMLIAALAGGLRYDMLEPRLKTTAASLQIILFTTKELLVWERNATVRMLDGIRE